MPSKYDEIVEANPCVYAITHDREYIFEKKGKAVFACGLAGSGFKHTPYHGVRVLQLIEGKQKEADKFKL